MKGCFITLEGTDGSGKSTQLDLLTRSLMQAGCPVTVTREPGGCPVSEMMRSILLDPASDLCDISELLLCQAARAQHVHDVILPALEAGRIVLCDRFTHSTLAYQGWARGLDTGLIEQLNRLASFGLTPDLTVMLLVPPEQSFSRKGGADSADRIERCGSAFHQAVYDGYCAMAKNDSRIFALHTAEMTKQQTAALILERVLSLLQGK